MFKSEAIDSSSILRNPKPFFIEDENFCPYGFINISNNKIYCFDYSLKLKSEIEIPLDKIYDYSIDFDGKNYRLWVFGRKENFNKIGKIFEIKNEKWKDMEISLDDLYSEFSRKAKAPNGEKINLSKKSINIFDFKDNFYDLGAKVVLSIDEKDSSKENYFNSRRHFFELSYISEKILSIKQINLWFEFSDVSEIKWDGEKSTLFLPSLYQERNSGFAPMGEKSFIFYLSPAVSFPDNDGKYNEDVLDVYFYVFKFQSYNSTLDFFEDFFKIREKVYKQTKEKDKLWPLKIFWHIKKSEFLFLSPCKDEKESCYALIEID